MANRDIRLVPWGVYKDTLGTLEYDGTTVVEVTADGTVVITQNTAASDAVLTLTDGDGETGEVAKKSGGNFTITNREHGAPVQIRAENLASGADILCGNFDPDGASTVYYAGTAAFESSVAGIDVYDPDGANTTPAVRLQGPSSQYTSIFVNAGADLFIDHQIDSALIYLRGRTSVSATAVLFSGDPDGESVVHRAGSICGRTAGGGWEIHAVANDNPAATFFQNDNTTRNGFIQFVSTGISYWRNEVTASKSYIEGKNTSGTNRTLAIFDSDGPALTVNTAAGGVVVGAPTGGDKGTGTINATAVYDDNVLLTDYVFDAHLDGRIDFQKWDDLVPNRLERVQDGDDKTPPVDREVIRRHEPARRFNPSDLDPQVYAQKWQARRRLPAFDSPGGLPEQLPVGAWAQRLLETCEVQAIHIEALRQRIEALETGV